MDFQEEEDKKMQNFEAVLERAERIIAEEQTRNEFWFWRLWLRYETGGYALAYLIITLLFFVCLGLVLAFLLPAGPPPRTADLNSCYRGSKLMGDAICDDGNNVQACLFDGGDCCLEQKNRANCDVCKCRANFNSLRLGILLDKGKFTKIALDKSFTVPDESISKLVHEVENLDTCSILCMKDSPTTMWLYKETTKLCQCITTLHLAPTLPCNSSDSSSDNFQHSFMYIAKEASKFVCFTDNLSKDFVRLWGKEMNYTGEVSPVTNKANGQGLGVTLGNDVLSTFNGSWFHGFFHGQGKWTVSSSHSDSKGETYNGHWHQGRFHGWGVLTQADGIFQGNFSKGRKVSGQMAYSNGKVLEGRFDEEGGGFNCGPYCVLRFPNGDVYNGSLMGDHLYGSGVMNYSNGDYYDGHWERGVYSGQGIFVWKSGRFYSGVFRDGLKHCPSDQSQDACSMSFENGDRYQGQWLEDEMHGKGRMDFSNGDVYVGDFFKGLIHGYGALYDIVKNQTFSGQFFNGTYVNHTL